MRSQFTWRLKDRELKLGEHTLVMGVLNVTPDSFSEAGLHFSPQAAVEHGLRQLEQGADILDIGGESTRPGAKTGDKGMSAEEELRRILPVIDQVLHHRRDAIISVDTYKAAVARAAIKAGAQIVNDISGARWDRAMPAAMAELKCGAVLMHTRGRPDEWHNLPRLGGAELLALIKRELCASAESAMNAGVAREAIVFDPGFGFGKNFDENFALLARFGELHALGFPLLAGTSRKSFIGRALARQGKDLSATERLFGSVATATAAILAGAHIVRAHDVRPTVEAARMADEILKSGN
jgi:dihydropteroate synthase